MVVIVNIYFWCLFYRSVFNILTLTVAIIYLYHDHFNISIYLLNLSAAFDEQMMLDTLLDLKANKTVQIPEYDFKNHCM